MALNISIKGDTVSLPTSTSYHFSNPKIIEVHLENKDKFFIGIEEGFLHYRVGKKKLKHFILTKEQNYFFKKTNKLISNTLLNWDMEDQTLIVKGSTTPDILYNYLFKECKKSRAKIRLQIPNHNQEIHPCLGHLHTKPKVQVHLMLINRARLKDKSIGLGAASALPWNMTKEGQFQIQNVFGEIKASRSQEKSKGEMIFEGLISLDQPLKFTNGLEVGVQPRSILARSGVEWKNITSHISLDLLNFNKKQALLEVDFKKMSRTGKANVFKTESFKRKNQLNLGQWIKILTYIETTKDHQRRSPLGLFLLGEGSRSQTSQKKELWLKLTDMETL